MVTSFPVETRIVPPPPHCGISVSIGQRGVLQEGRMDDVHRPTRHVLSRNRADRADAGKYVFVPIRETSSRLDCSPSFSCLCVVAGEWSMRVACLQR
jgi:hypothetical protein